MLATLAISLFAGQSLRPFSAPASLVFNISTSGQAKSEIVIPKGASLGTRNGAEILQSALDRITGAAIPIIDLSTNHADAGLNKILLTQSSRMGSEQYSIVCRPGKLTITGGALRGVMYGCIGLLQDHLNCHWYTAKNESIPSHGSLSLPLFIDREKPAFEYREPYFTEAWNTKWAEMNRCNGNSMDLPDSVGGRVRYGAFVHTLSSLVPPKKYFKIHPEYYALVNGKRNPDQLELTNPAVAQIAIKTVEKWIRENPKATIFSVSQNDNWNQSQSPESMAINKREGASSGLVLQFVNKVAAAIAKKHPNVLIDTLAYQWTEKPPKYTRPLPNVRVRLAPIGADYAHALNKSLQNKVPYDNLVEWGKITHQLYIWSYCTNFAHYLQPLPDFDEISGDIPLFKKHGVVGVFYEGDYAAGGGGSFAELKSYLIAQLLWNPYQNAQHLITDFVNHVYGKAAPEIMAWLNLLQEPARKSGIPASIYDPPTAKYFSDQELAQGNILFAKALDPVPKGVKGHDEVEKAWMGLLYLEVTRSKPGSAEFVKDAAILARLIKKFGVTETSEGGSSSVFLKSLGQQ